MQHWLFFDSRRILYQWCTPQHAGDTWQFWTGKLPVSMDGVVADLLSSHQFHFGLEGYVGGGWWCAFTLEAIFTVLLIFCVPD